jgi:hypothetical protein
LRRVPVLLLLLRLRLLSLLRRSLFFLRFMLAHAAPDGCPGYTVATGFVAGDTADRRALGTALRARKTGCGSKRGK